MSFVTTLLAEGGTPGFETPPDPCPHSGAATSAATSVIADHRARYFIPTSVEGRSLLSRAQRKSDVHIAAGSGLIIALKRRVDNHRPDVRAIEYVVEPDEGVHAQGADRAIPPRSHVRGPPRASGGVQGVVHEETRRVGLLDLRPATARQRGAPPQ